MLNIFKGKVIFKKDRSLILENDFCLREIIVTNIENYLFDQIYKFYIYEYRTLVNKANEEVCIYGFDNLNDLIAFESLLKIDGVGLKTAQKIIAVGTDRLKEIVQENDFGEMMKEFGLSNKIASNIFSYFSTLSKKKCSSKDISKINEAIFNLEKLGYTKQISTKVV
ncbi:hypothetical protein IKD48_00910 [bacterium]|nr:hypothetical protein [bacterium]